MEPHVRGALHQDRRASARRCSSRSRARPKRDRARRCGWRGRRSSIEDGALQLSSHDMTVAELEVIAADVTALEVDAIANAANTQLIHGGGVAGAISRAGGPEVQRESDERAPIGLGEAVETTAGDMPCRWVIHAATMELGGPTSARDHRARHAFHAREGGGAGCAFARTCRVRHRSGRLSAEEAARIMVGAAREHDGRARADRLRGAR